VQAVGSPERRLHRLAGVLTCCGVLSLVALLVLLTSLMSQQPNNAWGLSRVRLTPRLPDLVVYGPVGLFGLGAIAVVAVLFPRDVRFRRKKQPVTLTSVADRPPQPPRFSVPPTHAPTALASAYSLWRYQGTLTTTMRRSPFNNSRAASSLVRWLWRRYWYQCR
jgi:hypothetical protein